MKRRLYFIFIIPALYIALAPLFVMQRGAARIGMPQTVHAVGIVFGAGIKTDNTPKDMLRDRLIVAAQQYRAGTIKKILVSGDNRFLNYNEPDAMATYLIDVEKIPATDIARDYAGRSTYETCARAHEIFNVSDAILISQAYHLPRAIFLCKSFGIQSEGVSATLQPYRGNRYFKFREFFATHKAILDMYILHPDFIRGEKIEI